MLMRPTLGKGKATDKISKFTGLERGKEAKEAADKFEAQIKKYEEMMKQQKAAHKAKCDEYDVRISELEKMRQQDGGDWSKERAEAMEREQEINGRVSQLE